MVEKKIFMLKSYSMLWIIQSSDTYFYEMACAVRLYQHEVLKKFRFVNYGLQTLAIAHLCSIHFSGLIPDNATTIHLKGAALRSRR